MEAGCFGSTGNTHSAHNDPGVVLTPLSLPSVLRISRSPYHVIPSYATLWTCPLAAQQLDTIDDMPQHLQTGLLCAPFIRLLWIVQYLSMLYPKLFEASCDGCRQIPGCRARASTPTTACSLTAATLSLLVRPQRLELSTESPVLLLVYLLHASLVQ